MSKIQRWIGLGGFLLLLSVLAFGCEFDDDCYEEGLIVCTRIDSCTPDENDIAKCFFRSECKGGSWDDQRVSECSDFTSH